MMRRLVSSTAAVAPARAFSQYNEDSISAARHDRAPRADGDFEFVGGDQAVPGAHPLPLEDHDVEASAFPLVSPFMPSPQRIHPYFTEPLPELPHFDCSVPVVYPAKVVKERIVAPVFDTATGSVSHTRELDPFVFGQYPENDMLSYQAIYWLVRTQNYKTHYELGRHEIFKKAKKNWANTGTGMSRQSDRKHASFPWGGRTKPNKPWNMLMPTADPTKWHTASRMTLALKMLQGKLQVVDRLTLPEPTVEAFRDLCDRMQWDVRHTGGGVLFMDGGSRLTPSMEFDTSFFYGSFHNGRNKLVRPTVRVFDPIDGNRFSSNRSVRNGPKGPKNPVPPNRFNAFDALDHHLLVVTEGAVLQLEREMEALKVAALPPHIRDQMAAAGLLAHPLSGEVAAPLGTIEAEAAGRAEEAEKAMYEPFYDNPYRPWADEAEASYEVDATDGVIRRHVPPTADGDTIPGSWTKLE